MKSAKKSVLNIFSFVDLAVLALWLAVYVLARLTADTAATDYFSAAFVIVYVAEILWVLFYTAASIVLMIKKAPFSPAPLIVAYAANVVWIIVLVAVIKNITIMGSTLF